MELTIDALLPWLWYAALFLGGFAGGFLLGFFLGDNYCEEIRYRFLGGK